MFEDVRRRLREQLQARNVDAYLAYTPSNIFYTTGFLSPVVALSWRLMGTDLALIPADPASPPALITSDFVETPARAATTIEDIRTYRMWVENRDVDIITGSSQGEAQLFRPPQWDKAEIHGATSATPSGWTRSWRSLPSSAQTSTGSSSRGWCCAWRRPTTRRAWGPIRLRTCC